MEIFTYSDYIKYIHTMRLSRVLELAEEGISYNVKENENIEINSNNILKNKEKIIRILNKYLKLKNKISNEGLSFYKFNDREDFIVYKKKKEQLYFLIQIQTKTIKNPEYRILNSSIKVLEKIIKDIKKEKIKHLPILVPIVIYINVDNERKSYKFKYNKIFFKDTKQLELI